MKKCIPAALMAASLAILAANSDVRAGDKASDGKVVNLKVTADESGKLQIEMDQGDLVTKCSELQSRMVLADGTVLVLDIRPSQTAQVSTAGASSCCSDGGCAVAASKCEGKCQKDAKVAATATCAGCRAACNTEEVEDIVLGSCVCSDSGVKGKIESVDANSSKACPSLLSSCDAKTLNGVLFGIGVCSDACAKNTIPPGELDVAIDVTEARTGRIMVGPGITCDDIRGASIVKECEEELLGIQLTNNECSKADTAECTKGKADRALEKPLFLDLEDATLSNALSEIGQSVGVNVVIDHFALQRVNFENTINFESEGLKTRNALNLLLKPLGLKSVVEDDVLKITAEPKKAE